MSPTSNRCVPNNRWSGNSMLTGESVGDSREQIFASIEPLIARLREYDEARLSLEEQSSSCKVVKQITRLLSDRFTLPHRLGDYRASLSDRSGLSHFLSNLGDGGVKLNVTRLPSGMVGYYMCRTMTDYWSVYSLVVEDIYRSAGYRFVDGRFAKQMHFGHEVYYLRLSPLRERIFSMLAKGVTVSETRTDTILHRAGRHVLQAAWHENQRPGVLTAEAFGLDHFRQAIELVYLAQRGNLCELRAMVNADLIAFFQTVYRQPAICNFLQELVEIDGAQLSAISSRAQDLRIRLKHVARNFLRTKVMHNGQPKVLEPLIMGRMFDLPGVVAEIEDDGALSEAVKQIEAKATEIQCQIIG